TDVSTGFFADTEAARGSFHGVPYTEIHHNIRPDHLAVLPEAVGACNWRDGCGTPRISHRLTVACPCGGTCDTWQERSAMDDVPEEPTGFRRFYAALADFFRREDGVQIQVL